MFRPIWGDSIARSGVASLRSAQASPPTAPGGDDTAVDDFPLVYLPNSNFNNRVLTPKSSIPPLPHVGEGPGVRASANPVLPEVDISREDIIRTNLSSSRHHCLQRISPSAPSRDRNGIGICPIQDKGSKFAFIRVIRGN
jgi:hypothetical protein